MSRPPGIDTSTPSIARVYDAMLGGKDNFDVDREMLAQIVATFPSLPAMLKAGRAFIQRAVRWLVTEPAIDQFLDLGTGLPTADNVHQVAQRVNPDVTVVYVDNDPIVAAHGRALLEDEERSFFVAADLTKPEEVLANRAVTGRLDLDRPLALLQCATMHFVPDQAEAEAIMRGYIDRLPAGSYVVLTHAHLPGPDHEHHDGILEATTSYRKAVPSYTPRPVADIRALLPGLELVPPGLVPLVTWWPEGPLLDPPADAETFYGAVARKP